MQKLEKHWSKGQFEVFRSTAAVRPVMQDLSLAQNACVHVEFTRVKAS